eukprot:210853_1
MSTFLDEKLSNATVIADELWRNNNKHRRDNSLNLLVKIFKNVKDHPDVSKFRRINTLKVLSKHSTVPEFHPLLLASGFIAAGDGIHVVLYDEYLDLCTAVYSILYDRITYEDDKMGVETQKRIDISNEMRTMKDKSDSDLKDVSQEYQATVTLNT